MDANAQPSLSQIQSPSKFDDVGRVRKRFDDLRKHHKDSFEIHENTQPIIDQQIHEETNKYLNSGQVNGTKTKNQKPRVPKRQRNTANPAAAQTNPVVVTSTTNGIPPQPHIQSQSQTQSQSSSQLQAQPQPQPQPQAPPPTQVVAGQQHTITYTPRIQQNPIHMQQPQPQQHYAQQRFIYQQSQQPTTMQTQLKQPPQMYPQQQQMQHPSSHADPQYVAQHYGNINNNNNNLHNHHHHPQQPQPQQPQHSLQHHHNHHHHHSHHPHLHHHHHHQNHYAHPPFTTLPNDLDLNLQAGLECDVDSLIKHEMSVEGQLDFNHDLIQRILF